MSEFNSKDYLLNQKREWNDVASSWKKWDSWLDKSMDNCNLSLRDSAMIQKGHNVLDLGSGTGYPAITISKQVGENGSVLALDLSEEMLDVARDKCKKLNIQTITFKCQDVSEIPCDDNSFDAVTSRFCLMFLPFPEKTLKHVLRVLKNGSWFSGAVWASKESNPAFSIPLGVLQRFMDLPKPDPSKPGLFSLAEPKRLTEKMESAGFTSVKVEELPIVWNYDSPQEYVQGFKDLAAPFKPLVNSLSPKIKQEFENQLAKAVEGYSKNGTISINGKALIVSGRKLN